MMVIAGEKNDLKVTGSGFASDCVVDVTGDVALIDYVRLDEKNLALVVEGKGLDAELASVTVANPGGHSHTLEDCLESWERYEGD